MKTKDGQLYLLKREIKALKQLLENENLTQTQRDIIEFIIQITA